MKTIFTLAIATLLTVSGGAFAQNSAFEGMSFFVTSVGSGQGGDLGGLAGADAHCQALATTVGAGNRDWRAYLSNDASNFGDLINARDRIGAGPWYNAHGTLIAADLYDLHLYNDTLTAYTAVDENGNIIDSSRHDMLTGATQGGSAFLPDEADHTCNNWTSSDEGSANLGHSDRWGGNVSWNDTHVSAGCSQQALISTGGDGLFYCFAAD
ncbi:hypothetical protein JYT97_03860 [Haliea sp. AH-315-K21]|uniref:Lectin n=1 Tax=SAR86 cluster bacterium TaxID=2030880 RepID=A0A2A5CH72_9GAMM|nr:hypothetical protein [Haliea sp. AH-315-K21]PCJ42851.1 MAG: hypothetical protein COA71_04960 [SAR86 cluster bacterium]